MLVISVVRLIVDWLWLVIGLNSVMLLVVVGIVIVG